MKQLRLHVVPTLAFSLLLASQLSAQSSPQPSVDIPGRPLAIQVEPADFGLFPHTGRTKMEFDPFITLNAAFTPDGNAVYFSKSLPGWTTLTIFASHRTAHGWSAPTVAPFSGVYRDTDPVVTPDGKSILFASTRPPIGHLPYSYGLYQASLTGPDAGKAVPLSVVINEPSTSNLYPSLAADGTLYFIRPIGKAARIFRATLGPDGYQKPQQLSFPGDTDSISDSDAVVEPHQHFLIFTSNRPDSAGSMDIYLAFHHGDAWCKPIHLDAIRQHRGAGVSSRPRPGWPHPLLLLQPQRSEAAARSGRQCRRLYQRSCQL
jgi:hypothetical protein